MRRAERLQFLFQTKYLITIGTHPHSPVSNLHKVPYTRRSKRNVAPFPQVPRNFQKPTFRRLDHVRNDSLEEPTAGSGNLAVNPLFAALAGDRPPEWDRLSPLPTRGTYDENSFRRHESTRLASSNTTCPRPLA